MPNDPAIACLIAALREARGRAAVGLLLVGCGVGSSMGDGPAASDAGTAVDSERTDTGSDPTGTSAPFAVVEAPALSIAERAPLTARLTVATEVPTTLVAHLDDGARSWSLAWDEARTEHEVPLVGAHSDSTVQVVVDLAAADGTLSVDVGSYVTQALPADLARIQTTVSEPDRMEPGYTLLTAAGWLLLIDAAAEPVWMSPAEGAASELLPTAHGTYRYLSNRSRIFEVDPFGEVVGGWHSSASEDARLLPLDLLAMHHDVKELPDGTLITLSIERRFFPFPTSETDPTAPLADAWVAGDVLVHFDRSGAVLDRFEMLDRLDPTRIGFDSLTGTFWEGYIPAWGNDAVEDWSHGNAVHYDAASDRYLLGLRHQDAVVALEAGTGEVAWILAPPANWSGPAAEHLLAPHPDVELLPYHMHGAKFTASDRVIVFDNGNRRASAYEVPDPTGSRAVEFEIDEMARTFRPVWSYGLEENVFAGAMGDADVLPTTDNVLITWGSVNGDPRGTSRIQEVTRDGDTVFDVWMPLGNQFRSERVPSLLP